jgi:hypothetical protein
MSTQLILYPQNYNGYSTSSTSATEYVVDGKFFTTLNSSSFITFSGSLFFLFQNQPPTIPNTWYRTRENAATNYPLEISNTLRLNTVSTSFYVSAVYQRLSNLTIGQTYTITIHLTANPSGTVYVSARRGTGMFASIVLNSFSANTILITQDFTAQTTEDIIYVAFGDGTTNNLLIDKISVKETGLPPSMVYTDLSDGQVICDLYQEEDIPLSLSVDNFTNVAEKVQSYSKNFNLPATKRNNQIFNNMFEITRADDGLIFNPYVKTQCVLKQDGFLIFEGYLRMIDIKEKDGEISYNVNLYSEVIALADTLKDKTFADLDLTELTSDYKINDIKDSWDDTIGLPLENSLSVTSFARDPSLASNHTNVMKYPFIDWNHQFSLTGGVVDLPNLNSAFRPCIQIKYLINKIFSAAGFTWTSTFFDTTDFGKLFMDFNWGNDENPTDLNYSGWKDYRPETLPAPNFVANPNQPIKFTGGVLPSQAGYDTSTGVFTVPAGQGDTDYYFSITVDFVLCNYDEAPDLTAQFLKNGVYVPTSGFTWQSTTNAGHGSAIAYVDSIVAGQLQSIALQTNRGGWYDSAPTVTIDTSQGAPLSSGSGATATATGTFPGPVTGITMTNVGSGYDSNHPPYVMFNNVEKDECVRTYTANFSVDLEDGDVLQPVFGTTGTHSSHQYAILQDNRWNIYGLGQVYSISRTAWMYVNTGVDVLTSQGLLNTLRGDLGQWDFIKGIMTMFNLVSLPDDTNKNNIIIETYNDIFIKHTNSGDMSPAGMTLAHRSIEHDWTDKVDVSQMELKPLTDLNKNTIFKFVEDDDDYSFNAYKMATAGGLYGAKYWDASGFTILEGEEEIVAEPFAATVIKPLQEGLNDFIAPAIYAVDESGESDGFDNSPRILYNNGVKTLSSTTYNIPSQNGHAGISGETQYLQFSHLSDIPIAPGTTRDFNFESQQLIQPLSMFGVPADNLFTTYWLPYFSELYSPDTRTMTLKVNLTPSDINTFKFYDTVMIKNRTFRVNKIEYKPNTLAKVEFILIG